MSVMNQTYSYSRLSSFATCPYKWYETYVNKYKEPARTYFSVGTVCHRVAELSAEYCVRETWANKAVVFYGKSKDLADINVDKMDPYDFAFNIHDNKKSIRGTVFNSFGELSFKIDDSVTTEEYEIVSMPTGEIFWSFFDRAIAEERVTDSGIVEESRFILKGFFYWYDFSLLPGEVMLAEKKLAFTESWSKTGFFDGDAFFRGVIDNTIYSGDGDIIITDYKTSRVMMNQSQVSNDPQLMAYVKMLVHTIGRDAINSITIRISYMRYKNMVSHTFTGREIDVAVDTITTWIEELVSQIRSKGDSLANYECVRNQYCSRCHIREDGNCPIFTRLELREAISLEVSDEESCKLAWKQSEALKDRYTTYAKQCKEFINSTDGLVKIDDNALLGKHIKEVKKFNVKDLITQGLKSGATLEEMLPFLSVSETSVKKMIKRLKLSVNLDDLYTVSTRETFAALTREEM